MGSFKNGTPFSIDAYPNEAVVVTQGDSSNGRWGEYSSWTSTPNLQKWEMKFQDEKYGVKGCMGFQSVCFPCHDIATFGLLDMLILSVGPTASPLRPS